MKIEFYTSTNGEFEELATEELDFIPPVGSVYLNEKHNSKYCINLILFSGTRLIAIVAPRVDNRNYLQTFK